MDAEQPSTASHSIGPGPGQDTNVRQGAPGASVGEAPYAGLAGAVQGEAASSLLGAAPAPSVSAVPVQAATPAARSPDAVQTAPPVRRHFRPHLGPINIHLRVHTFDSWRFRDFRLLWGATAFFSGGLWLQQVIVGWLTYSLTGSAFLTSLALSLDALPVLLVGPLGGLLVDNSDRRKLLAFVFAYQAALTLAFSLLVFLDRAGAWQIFGFILLMGVSWVVTDPARMAIIPNIVPKKNLVNAFALNSLAFSSTRLAIPAVGGAILAFFGAGPALLLEAGLLLMALFMVLGLRVSPQSRPRRYLRSAFAQLVEGARYVKGEPFVLGVMLIGIIPPLLVIPFIQGLMPVYAAQVFDVGPTGLGFLISAIGVGSVGGSIVLASLGDVFRKGRLVVISMIATGVAVVAFSRAPSYAIAFASLVLFSAALMTYFATATATVQGLVSDEFRGRVTSLYMASFGLMPIGSIMAGTLADRLGAPSATLIAGVMLAVILTALAIPLRSIWRMR